MADYCTYYIFFRNNYIITKNYIRNDVTIFISKIFAPYITYVNVAVHNFCLVSIWRSMSRSDIIMLKS